MYAPPWWLWIFVAVALTEVATFATSIYLHRAITHRSLTVRPAVDMIFRVVLWLTTGQRRQEWAAVHRKHHAFTDRDGDPHSPRLFGFWHVQFGNVFYYMREAKNPETVRMFAPDILDDHWDRRIFSHGRCGLALGIAGLCVIFGTWAGLTIAATHAIIYVFVVAPIINGLGHWRGRRNFPNTAFNSRALAWFTAGESLHNNHHAHPRSPKFSMKRGEFDPSWLAILLLRQLRCATIIGRPVLLKDNDPEFTENNPGSGKPQ